MKKYRLIFLCLFLPCILYAETTSDIIQDVKILLDEGTWVPKHYLDVLEAKDRDYMSNFVKDIDNFNTDMNEIDRLEGLIPFDSKPPPNILYWYEHGLRSFEPLEFYSYRSDNFFRIGYNHINIVDAVYVGNMVKFTSRVDKDNRYNHLSTLLDWSKLIENEEIFDIFFIFDGDYLHVYIDEVVPENLFYTFARMDDTTVNEYKTLMASNTCDLSNVIWPRYADGSSDYDDKITLTHKVGNIYRTTDNLRIRHEEGLTGNPLFTLPKDTLVKVLKLGVAELIDSITADWLQVEVVEDTIDTAGNEVKKGAIGWCFGGYVTTSPEIVVEEVVPEIVAKEQKKLVPELVVDVSTELESTEENATAQAIPWVIGGGVLLLGAVGVAVVVIRKKKK